MDIKVPYSKQASSKLELVAQKVFSASLAHLVAPETFVISPCRHSTSSHNSGRMTKIGPSKGSYAIVSTTKREMMAKKTNGQEETECVLFVLALLVAHSIGY